MSRLIQFALVMLVPFHSLFLLPTKTTEVPSNCEAGEQANGALYLICVPDGQEWNGDLLIYAHGYVAFNEPLALPDLELPSGLFIPDIINALGYAFATTSYSTNGLAVLEGVEDVKDLVDIFTVAHAQPNFVYLFGASEGGIITTLAVEQFPGVFDGGLAACGPIGDFRQQITYWGDFRAVFDAFFPDVIPGSPVEIPAEVIENWGTIYAPNILQAIEANLGATIQILRVTDAPVDWKNPITVNATVLELLWYNVFATNDGIEKLNGQPFDNLNRIYTGSANDLLLNLVVERFAADPDAIDEIEAHYQTSGELVSPLLTIHTSGDPIVPYRHAPLYRAKVIESGSSSLYGNIPFVRYGHCSFTVKELVTAFAILVHKVTNMELVGVEDVLSDDEWQEVFTPLAMAHHAQP
jgi:pimeloyl-ACP methyl ester carboxylesterase